MDVVACLGGGGALARVVAFVDDGEVEKIATKGEEEVIDGPLLKRNGFQRGEAVDAERDGED